MASEADILRLRRITDTLDNQDPYTDELLSAMIDQLGFEAAASTIWHEKAAQYSTMVDITESGSTRRFSQLHDHALKMGDAWKPPEQDPTISGGSYTVAIERM